ncbi:1-acyl-sn-glycerol-3-phosphate acyltransferase [Candidatus Gracilibacteria bacterium]|nr:1-acyl-sn-glycerol-3-phosphate acyltransferase [Candidatus Gracilibacteria bacterium]
MKIILFLVRRILSLRYSVDLKGVENLKHAGPVLILPNHVALVDPRIIISFLGKYLNVSPVASEKYYNKPVLKQIMDFVGTVPIGEMDAGADPEKVIEVFTKIVEAMQSGKNILIYPSGQIYRQGFESIKGKQAAYNIAKVMPENTKVIGIKDRGLWGSIWSMAWDNGTSGFGTLYLKSIWYVLANFVFFVPKRKVNIHIEDITEQINTYKNMSLNEFNGFLENFYNKDGEEEINYIKHYFYFDDVKDREEPEMISGSLEELNNTKSHDLSKIDSEIKNKIITKISELKEIDAKLVKEDSNLILNLFFDSLDLAETKSFVAGNFPGASNPPIGDLKTVGDLIIMAVGQSDNVEELKDCQWKENLNSGDLVEKLV